MRRWLPAMLFLTLGCAEEGALDPEGAHWDVTVEGSVDTCHAEGEGVGFRQTYVYSLFYEGSITDLRIGGDSFATGIVSGCSLSYESPIIGEERESGELKWQLTGEATLRAGGDGCSLGDGSDWVGTETFEIVESQDPDIEVGCEYTMTVEGMYVDLN